MSTQKPIFAPLKKAKPEKTAKPARPNEEESIILYGWHPVKEALRNERRIIKSLKATDNAAQRLKEEGIALPPKTQIIRPQELDRLLPPDAVHQGLYLEAEPLPALDLRDLDQEGLVLVLDQVTDPHNVGAILRSAAAFNVQALIVTHRNSPAATGVLAKSASGGLEHVPIISISNLAQGLMILGDMGFTRIGLDSEGPVSLADIRPPRPVALVLGAEGKGLRHLTRERCDVLARLDMPGKIKSLNVSNAAALALFCLR